MNKNRAILSDAMNIASISVLMVLLFFGPAIFLHFESKEKIFDLSVLIFAFAIATIGAITIKKNGPRLIDIRPVKLIVLRFFILMFVIKNIALAFHVFTSGGHNVLYTESDPLYITALKILALPGYFSAALLLFTNARPADKALAILGVFSSAFAGSRGILIFTAISYFLLNKGATTFFKPKMLLLATIGVSGFLVIGRFREEMSVDLVPYIGIVINSLNEFAIYNIDNSYCRIDSWLVFKQFPSLLTGSIDPSRVTFQITNCINPLALSDGYGIASSGPGESRLLFGEYWTLFYVAYCFIISTIIAYFLHSRSFILRSLGVTCLPFFIYVVRAELLYPFTFALRFVLLAIFLLLISYILTFATKNP